MKELIKNAVILFVITLFAGALLGFMYELTKGPRAEQEAKAIQNAYKNVYSSAAGFESYDFDVEEVADALIEKGITPSMDLIDEVVTAVDENNEVLGYVITVTAKEGYAGDIKYTVGIRNDGTVTGISFLSIKETAGLGMKAKDAQFKDQFVGKNVEFFEYSKAGAVEDNQIDAITGATITTNAVTNGVNAALYCFDYIVGLGGDSIE